jgi:sec-independent protein translocase protein TatA
MLGWKELLFIAIVIVILFGGATQLPKIMRSLGEGLREFKKSVKDVKKDIDVDEDTNDTDDSSQQV